jgi:acetyl esterase/lipase
MKYFNNVFFPFVVCTLSLLPDLYGQQVIPLYSGRVPNSKKVNMHEVIEKNWGVNTVRNVIDPSMSVYLPDGHNSARSGVIIFPGGGYYVEAYEIEGTQIAEALVKHGVAAFVVRYRLPADSTMVDKSIGPLQDAQQAIKLVRERAASWGIDSNKIGVMGFSAGGHLASTAGTHFGKAFIPDKEGISLRPDFMVLVYPVISMTDRLAHMGSRNLLLGEHPSDSLIDFFSGEMNVTGNTPPTFLIQAEDDKTVDPDNSIEFFEALRHHNVPSELVIIPKGEHGFAARIPPEEWMQPLFSWMRDNDWMK